MLTKQALIEQSGVHRATINRMIQKGILKYSDLEHKLFDDDALKIVQSNYHEGQRRNVSNWKTFSNLVQPAQAVEVVVEPDVVKPQAEENATLERRAERIRKLSGEAQIRLVAIGFELIAAKEQVGHGGWAEWLRTEFKWTQRTANNFMRIAERFGKMENVFHFQPSTLQAMLALPVGEEDDFIATQAELGRPIESQSARQVQQSVKEWNKRAESPADASNTPDTIETSTDTPKTLKTPHKPLISLSTGNQEWYTPPVYIEAARAVLGEIDLDPASCELANQIVNAKKFFSADADGLCNEWHGRIWLNPPFKAGLIDRFVDKLLDSNFDAAIVLTDNATDTRWFCKLATAADAILFTTGRINFLKSDGSQEVGNHIRGQAFFYFGSRADLFADVFARFGWLAKSFSLKEKNHVDV